MFGLLTHLAPTQGPEKPRLPQDALANDTDCASGDEMGGQGVFRPG